jgi:hypothetical protein
MQIPWPTFDGIDYFLEIVRFAYTAAMIQYGGDPHRA